MKVLITGGCGFLGSNLAERALKQGMDLIIFDNLSRYGSYQNLEWLKEKGKFKYIHGDIRNENDVEKVIRQNVPDTIFHLAGQVAMTTSMEDPAKDFAVNALGSHHLLEAVRKYAPKASVVYSSTNKVYGDLEQYTYEETESRYICKEFANGFTEDVQLSFHSPYGCSKGAADQCMLDYARIFGLNTVVLRHSSMYGGRQFATYDQGWIGWFCQKAIEIKERKQKEKFTISGTGKQVRDVAYAEDIVDLYFSCVENIEKVKGEAFNVGGGIENSLSLLELFKMLEEELEIEMKYRKIEWRESDQRVFVADLKKINKNTAWKPKVDKKSGINKMVNWIEKTVK